MPAGGHARLSPRPNRGERAVAELLEARGRLDVVVAQLRRTPLTIAYFGASVTAQRSGYRPRLVAALQAATGQDHRSVNAGIGGVGSISGLFLMDRLVLARRPQLCLVEFSLADRFGWTPPELLGPALEAIVWGLRAHECEPCFLHLYRADNADRGALDTYRRVGQHHSVSSIDVAGYLEKCIECGMYASGDIVRDVVHTTERGSDMVADAIASALTCTPGNGRPETAEAAPLYGRRFHQPRLLPAKVEHLRYARRHTAGRFRFTYDYLTIGSDNALECEFDGELVGLVIVVGPAAGVIRVSGEGRCTEFSTWDPSCYYERLTTVVLDRPWPPHTAVKVEPTDEPVDYAGAVRPVPPADAPRQLKVIGFMVGS